MSPTSTLYLAAAEHGRGDTGIFTIGVPLTYAVAKVLTAWIKHRTPATEVNVGDRNSGRRAYEENSEIRFLTDGRI